MTKERHYEVFQSFSPGFHRSSAFTHSILGVGDLFGNSFFHWIVPKNYWIQNKIQNIHHSLKKYSFKSRKYSTELFIQKNWGKLFKIPIKGQSMVSEPSIGPRMGQGPLKLTEKAPINDSWIIWDEFETFFGDHFWHRQTKTRIYIQKDYSLV